MSEVFYQDAIGRLVNLLWPPNVVEDSRDNALTGGPVPFASAVDICSRLIAPTPWNPLPWGMAHL